MNNTKAPYSVSSPSASLALAALSPSALSQFTETITLLNTQRSFLLSALPTIPGLGRILGGNHANFVLVQVLDKPLEDGGKVSNVRAKEVYTKMAEEEKVVVRYRGNEVGCEGCLRITVGTPEESKAVVERLRSVLSQ
jgi:histidinol-phosphate aminotransferase